MKNHCLLAVQVFEFTGNEIGKLRKTYKHDRYLESVLPTYTFNDRGTVIESCGYLQFIDEGDKIITCFNATHCDELLGEEISNGGLDTLLKGIDIRPYLEKMQKLKFEDFNRSLRPSEYLILSLEYVGGYYYGADYADPDLNVEVIGALIGNKLEKFEIEK